jgi:hypothetical protein
MLSSPYTCEDIMDETAGSADGEAALWPQAFACAAQKIVEAQTLSGTSTDCGAEMLGGAVDRAFVFFVTP